MNTTTNPDELFARVDALLARRVPALPEADRHKIVKATILSGSWSLDGLGRLHRIHSHTLKAHGLEQLASPDHEEKVEYDQRFSDALAGRPYRPLTRPRPPLTQLEEAIGGRLEDVILAEVQ